MKPALRVLIVEDNEDDAELVLRALRKAYDVTYRRVETEPEMSAALADGWDLVLSDFSLPSFDAMRALGVLQHSGCDLPFVLISGTIGEETAVEAMKAGAHDFLVKGRLHRLVPAVERELRDARTRRERREAVERVQHSEQRLSGIFSQVAVGIVETDLEGRIALVNMRLCDILGCARGTVLGQRLQDLVQPDDRTALEEIFEDIHRGGRSFTVETRCVRSDGAQVWVNNTISVVTGDDGRPKFTVAVVQDITDKKRAEDDLRAAVRARDDFLSIASHELKTPITSLHPQLERLARFVREGRLHAVPDEKLEWMLNIAIRQVDRLTALVNNLLDVTRITSGRLHIAPTEVDLRELSMSVLSRYQEIVRRSGSEIVVSADAPVVGKWDPAAVETVITNLLSNAAKYGSGKPIRITVERKQDTARLIVQDQGIGIDPDKKERIFQRFERAVPLEHYGGLGLGLWIARQVVEAHGGNIGVSSSAGEGSTFTVELPIVTRRQAAAEGR